MSGCWGSPTVRGRRKSCGQMTDGSSLCEPVRLGMRRREAVIVCKEKSLMLPGKSATGARETTLSLERQLRGTCLSFSYAVVIDCV